MKRSSRLLISEHPLQLLPSLAVAVGLHEAIILQQIHYWLEQAGNEREGRYWVYNSYTDWQADNFPFLTVHQIRRAFEHLEALGVVEVSNYNAAPMDRTKWYTINYTELDALMPDAPSHLAPMPNAIGTHARPSGADARTIGTHARPIPETNTETNTRESTAPAPAAQVPYPAISADGARGDMDRDWEQVGHARAKQIRPGQPVNTRPDAPPVRPVPKASDDPMTAARWATLTQTWTADGTKITDPRECEQLFAQRAGEVQVQIVVAAAHYVAGRDRADGYGMSLRRFIEQENYTQWQTPERLRLQVVKPEAPAPRRRVLPEVPQDDDLTAIWNRPRTPRQVTA